MSNIGKKVKIIGGYSKYIGQIGTIVSDNYNTLVEVKMPDGKTVGPWINGNGINCGDHTPEAEWVEESYIGRRVKLDDKYYSGQIGTIEREVLWGKGQDRYVWQVRIEDGSVRIPWAATNTDPNYRQCELLPEETTNTNNQNQTNMSTQSNTQAPETFYITSEYPEIMKVFWEEMKKVGYTSDKEGQCRTWTRIVHNVQSKTVDSKENYMDMYISSHDHLGYTYGTQYQLPQQWTEALKHITDAAKYWEEQEKVIYKKGDWVVIVLPEGGDPVGTVTQVVRIEGNTLAVKNMGKSYSAVATWTAATSKVRPATPQEIQEASRYKIGDWVYIINAGCRCTTVDDTKNTIVNKDVVQVIEKKEHSNPCATYKTTGGWISGDPTNHRRATAEEIAAAQTQYVNIGTRQLSVAISSGKIIAEGRNVNIDQVRTIVENMEAKRKIGEWAVVYTTCNVGCVTGVTLAELQEIVKAYDKLTKN